MIPNAWKGFDFGLGENADLLRETAEKFSQAEIAPRADETGPTPFRAIFGRASAHSACSA